MGKKAIALAMLHHPEVASALPARYSVSEAITDLEAFRLQLVDSMGVPPQMRGQQLLAGSLQTPRAGPSVLCIENFETLWEPPQSR